VAAHGGAGAADRMIGVGHRGLNSQVCYGRDLKPPLAIGQWTDQSHNTATRRQAHASDNNTIGATRTCLLHHAS
jgi:hypothetical protein